MLARNIIHILSPLPTLVVCIFWLKIITVALKNGKYTICNTPTTPSRPIIHALQVLATYMPNTINIFYWQWKWVVLFVSCFCHLQNSNATLTRKFLARSDMIWASYANCCGSSHHFAHFGSWSGAAKIVHLKVAEQPRRTLFASSFPTTTIATTTTFHGHKWRRTSTHARTHTHHHDNSTMEEPRRPPSTINNVPFDRTSNIWRAGLGSRAWEKDGERTGTGTLEKWCRDMMPKYLSLKCITTHDLG